MKLTLFTSALALTFSASTALAKQDCTTPSLFDAYQKQAEKIYHNMSLDERIGQVLLPSYALLAEATSPHAEQCKATINNPQRSSEELIKACGLDQINSYHIGAVLTGGGPYYNAPTLENWAALNKLANKEHHLGSPQDPLLLTGNDAIHGNMHVQGAVIFPHNIGLGATHDAALIHDMASLVAKDSLASGFNWVYMPTVAITQDLHWGRSYESFGQDPHLVSTLAKAYIEGLQNIDGQKIHGVLATAKHFIGDGATQYGLDEGDDAYTGTEAQFWKEQASGYKAAVEANVGSIMVSYSAINGDDTRMHLGGKWNLINRFKKLGIHSANKTCYRFNGFMVSDWNGATRAAYFYEQQQGIHLSLPEIMAKAINSGVDMLMIAQADNSNPLDPNSPLNFQNVGDVFSAIKTAVEKKLISEDRLKEAVTRILRTKLAMQPETSNNYADLQAQERAVALKAAEESLVLLKNKDAVLPLNKDHITKIVFVGATNDIGLQNGGWTVNWQGQKGDQYFTGADKISSGAITLEEAIHDEFKQNNIQYFHANPLSQIALPAQLNAKNTIVIAAVAEMPYAEYMGDIANDQKKDLWYEFGVKTQANSYLGLPQNKFLGLMFSETEALAIQSLRKRGIKVITIVYSGRPLTLTEGGIKAPASNSDTVIAAFLPGTLGGKAIVNALFGYYPLEAKTVNTSNSPSFPWPER